MINRLYLQRFKLSLLIATLTLAVQNCVSWGVQLVHPQSGSMVRCGAAGIGIMAGPAESFVEDCIRSYEGKGFVAVDKLTHDERADLERRGVLPRPDDEHHM